jgi:hypothetical protein
VKLTRVVRFTRKSREQHRHDRAVVIQQLCTPTQSDVDADVQANQRRAAELRRYAKSKGKY